MMSKPSLSAFRLNRLKASLRRLRLSMTPPAGTISLGSSNWGFTSTTPSAPGRSRRVSGWSMVRAAAKETSTVKKSKGPGASWSERNLKCAPSSSVTRGSERSGSRIWSRPTSTPVTWDAPALRSAAVKPPWEQPTSMAFMPRIAERSPKCSKAASNLRPPRVTSAAASAACWLIARGANLRSRSGSRRRIHRSRRRRCGRSRSRWRRHRGSC